MITCEISRISSWQSVPDKNYVSAVRICEYIYLDIDRIYLRPNHLHIISLWYHMLNCGIMSVSCMCNRLYEAMIKVSGEIKDKQEKLLDFEAA